MVKIKAASFWKSTELTDETALVMEELALFLTKKENFGEAVVKRKGIADLDLTRLIGKVKVSGQINLGAPVVESLVFIKKEGEQPL